MKIEKVLIEGYRGFKDKLDIKLHPQVNVFVGVNGSGKTTVLDAVGMLLEMYVGYLFRETIHKYTDVLTEEEINTHSNLAKIQIETDWGGRWFIYNYRQQLDLLLENNNLVRDASKTRMHTHKKAEELLFSIKDKKQVPILAYYSTNRLFTDNQNEQGETQKKKYLFQVLECYENALDAKVNSFEDFENWFIENENRENRERLRNGQLNYRNPSLEYVRKVVLSFFNEIDKGLKYNHLYVDETSPNLANKRETIFIKKSDTEIRLDKLSDGEKTIILLVCDIARRLTMAHAAPESMDVLQGKGVVLIDEIELHLHPEWQRKVVPALMHVFPNIQFILSTHSPQVLSNLKREHIHLIEDFKLVKQLSPTYGEDSNSILWDIFGVKKQPQHAEEAFKKFYRLLEGENKGKAFESYLQLVKDYGKEHSEVKKANRDFEFEFGEYSD